MQRNRVLLLFFIMTSILNAQDEKALEEAVPLQGNGSELQYYSVGKSIVLSYSRPSKLGFIKSFPGGLAAYTRKVFSREYLKMNGVLLSSTLALVALDQQILDETQRFGNRMGLDGNNKMKRAFSVLGFPIEVPRDLDTGLYFIGDGWTHTGVALSFLGFGLLKNDNRALQTGSQIVEGMLTTGFVVQLLKHITGRESPFRSSKDGGRWDFFPNQIDYHKHVPRYDAFPSGHLATAMMTVTVIADNYPEKPIVKPIGYGLMLLLSFEMVNNGVHWTSDYPLALAMGYSFAKIAVNRGRTVHSTAQNSSFIKSVLPYIGRNGIGLQLKL